MDLRFGLMGLCLCWFACTRDPQISFNRDIRPILNEKCLKCHGGVKANGDLSFIRESDVYAVTQSGRPTLVPGSPGKSEMYRRLIHPDPELRMPYQQTPLTPEEIEIISKWIRQGAKWENHWAYEKPRSISPPEVPDTNFVRTEVDQFIYHQLQHLDLSPAPEADQMTLLRRLTLDLTGLPPTQEIKADFLKDSSGLAFNRLVDHLLQSPHYGER